MSESSGSGSAGQQWWGCAFAMDELISIVIADDHPVVLAGLRDLLQSAGGFDVVATCRDGIAALAAVRMHRPSILVLDLRMPGMGGLDVVRALRSDAERPGVVMLTAEMDGDEIERASALGVECVLLKEAALESLIDSIRAVHRGTPQAMKQGAAPRNSAAGVLGSLTPREREMALMIARGRTAAEIGQEVGATVSLVEAVIDSFCRQFGTSGVAALRELFLGAFEIDGPREERERLRDEEERLVRQFGFTRREAAVAALLEDGMTNREIAERLGITLNTVKTHISNVHAKTEVSSTRRLLVVLRQDGRRRE